MPKNVATMIINITEDKSVLTEFKGSLEMIYLGLAQLYNYDNKLFEKIEE